MRFLFERIGPVEEAELELGDLTVIAGRNNTGKTYLSYSLYGFLRLWRGWPGARGLANRRSRSRREKPGAVDLRVLTEQLAESSEARLAVTPEVLGEERRRLLEDLAKDFSEYMPQAVFSTSADAMADARISVKMSNAWPETSGSDDSLESLSPAGGMLSMNYDGKELVASWTRTGDRSGGTGARSDVHLLLEGLSRLYAWFLCSELPDPFVLSAERFGISLFYKELDFTKNQLVDLLQKLGEDENRDRVSPFLLIDRAASRYALPIKDNIDYTRELADRPAATGGLLAPNKFFNDVKNMLGGSFKSSGGDVRFRSKARKIGKFDIPLHLASSSARGLVDLYFFLRSSTVPNQLLIIDEPESHLDTRNQILMARLLARFVRAGLKVLITTHSDYVIKELNNLIMLAGLETNGRPDLDDDYLPDDGLDAGSVRAYVAEKNGLTRVEVDQFGMDMPMFDDTIDRINRTANRLAARLSAQVPE